MFRSSYFTFHATFCSSFISFRFILVFYFNFILILGSRMFCFVDFKVKRFKHSGCRVVQRLMLGIIKRVYFH